MNDDQIKQTMTSKLEGVRQLLLWNECQSNPTPANLPTQVAPSGTGPFTVWLQYIGVHIKFNTGFGPDYELITADAMKPQRSYNPVGPDSPCSVLPLKDTEWQQYMVQLKPADVGRSLLDYFEPYDDATREKADTYLSSLSH